MVHALRAAHSRSPFQGLPQIIPPFRCKIHKLLASDRLAHIGALWHGSPVRNIPVNGLNATVKRRYTLYAGPLIRTEARLAAATARGPRE